MGMGFGFNDFGFSGFGTGFSIFQIMFTLVFVIVIGMFIVIAVKGISQWNKNNHSPRLTVPAKIVDMRRKTHHHHSNGHHHHSHTYHVTFEVESGDRMELKVSRNEYGMLVVGDSGRVSFQGTRYLGFERG